MRLIQLIATPQLKGVPINDAAQSVEVGQAPIGDYAAEALNALDEPDDSFDPSFSIVITFKHDQLTGE